MLIDTHVHVYGSFDVDRFLDCAAERLARESKRRSIVGSVAGTLMLSETSRDHFFEAFAATTSGARWSPQPTQEDCSCIACCEGKPRLILIAGRQIIARENLEVLALGCCDRFEDQQPIETTIQQVFESGALCVLPWGVGKWTGDRGRVVKRLIDNSSDTKLFLADNGNRLGLSPMPRLLRYGLGRGLKVLAGSDPLPLVRHQTRAGGYGIVLSTPIDLETPAAQIKRAFEQTEDTLEFFGRLTSPGPFMTSQFAMQWRKRSKASS